MTSAVKTYGSHSDGELAHRVKGRRASVDELLDESRELGTRSPFTGEGISLLLGGNLAGGRSVFINFSESRTYRRTSLTFLALLRLKR